MIYNPLLMVDFYKCVHSEQYPINMTKIYSPGTPRMSRLKDVNEITYFGGQAFCKEYLINAFYDYFFSKSEEEVVNEYNRILTYTLGPGTYNPEKIRKLHRLGYLPIAVYAVPEGRSYTDGHTFQEAHIAENDNLLQLIFKDGKMVKEYNLAEIRENLYPEGF